MLLDGKTADELQTMLKLSTNAGSENSTMFDCLILCQYMFSVVYKLLFFNNSVAYYTVGIGFVSMMKLCEV